MSRSLSFVVVVVWVVCFFVLKRVVSKLRIYYLHWISGMTRLFSLFLDILHFVVCKNRQNKLTVHWTFYNRKTFLPFLKQYAMILSRQKLHMDLNFGDFIKVNIQKAQCAMYHKCYKLLKNLILKIPSQMNMTLTNRMSRLQTMYYKNLNRLNLNYNPLQF